MVKTTAYSKNAPMAMNTNDTSITRMNSDSRPMRIGNGIWYLKRNPCADVSPGCPIR